MPQGAGTGRSGGGPGRGRGHGAQNSSSGPRRTHENGNPTPSSKAPAGTDPAAVTAAGEQPAVQPKPTGGWGSGKSFASILATKPAPAAAPKPAADTGNAIDAASSGGKPHAASAAPAADNKPVADSTIAFGSFPEVDKESKERESAPPAKKGSAKEAAEYFGGPAPRVYLRTESAPPGTGEAARAGVAKYIPEKTSKPSRMAPQDSGKMSHKPSSQSSTGPVALPSSSSSVTSAPEAQTAPPAAAAQAPAPPPPPPAMPTTLPGQAPAPPPAPHAIPQAVAAVAPPPVQPQAVAAPVAVPVVPQPGAMPVPPMPMPAAGMVPQQQPAAPPPRDGGKHHGQAGYPMQQGQGRVMQAGRGGDGAHQGGPRGHYGGNRQQQQQQQQHGQQQMPMPVQYQGQPGQYLIPGAHGMTAPMMMVQSAHGMQPVMHYGAFPMGAFPGNSPPSPGMMQQGLPPIPPHLMGQFMGHMMGQQPGGGVQGQPGIPPPPPPQAQHGMQPPQHMQPPQPAQAQHVVNHTGGQPGQAVGQQGHGHAGQQPPHAAPQAGGAAHPAPPHRGPAHGSTGQGTPGSTGSQSGASASSTGVAPPAKRVLKIYDPKSHSEVKLDIPASTTAKPAAPPPAPPPAAPVTPAPAPAPAKPAQPTAARAIKPPTPEALSKHHHKSSSGSSPAPTATAAPAAPAAAAAPIAAALQAAAAAAAAPKEEPAQEQPATAEPAKVEPAKEESAKEESAQQVEAAPSPVAVEQPAAEEAAAATPAAPQTPAAVEAPAPVPEPTPAEPAPAQPEPAQPEPAQPEPAQPQPAQPAAMETAAEVPAQAPELPVAEAPTTLPPIAEEVKAEALAEAAPAAPGPAEEAAAAPAANGISEPSAEEAAASEQLAGDAGAEVVSVAPVKKKHSIKDVGRRGDARDDELQHAADPFAKKPPAEASAPAAPPPPPPARPTKPAEQAAEGTAREEGVSENWESAAEGEGKSSGGASIPAPDLSGRKVYSRDFLKSRAQVYDRPADLANTTYRNEIVLDEPRRFDSSAIIDLQSVHSGNLGGGGRRGGGGGGGGGGGPPRQGDEWARKGQQPQFQDARLAPQRSGTMGRDGGRMDRRGSQQVDDKWGRLTPSSPAGRQGRDGMMSRGASGMLPQLHRTDNRFVVGQVQSDDPEEEKRQKQFQGILNKITPDNFERLTRKCVEDVGIPEQRTLGGLIDKIFDKALTDMHFCELYSRMCKELSMHPMTPKFDNPEPGGKPIDLRRLLLYKCQEEFEKGAKAMESVAEHEAQEGTEQQDQSQSGGGDAEEAKKAAEETKPAEEQKEEGELSPEKGDKQDADKPPRELTAAEKRAAARKAAEADRAARRRMLGNIQFIGYLYKMGLITERILHSCIQTLLKEQDNPRPEDVECLSKLLTTVGAQLDATTKAEYKKAMLVYFERLQRLRDNKKLESRIRFMIQDVLDLRQNNWIPRTKKEGPKKIADVHQEAQAELMAQQQRDREESMRRGGDRDRRGPPGPPQRTNYDRLLSRDEMPNRTIQMQRAPSSELSFRPSGAGFGRRNASPSPAAAAAAAAAGRPGGGPAAPSPFAQAIAGRERAPAPPAQPPAPAFLGEAETRRPTEGAVQEFSQHKSVDELLLAYADLRQKHASMAQVLRFTLQAAMEQRGVEFGQRITPFVEVFKQAAGKPADQGGFTAAEIEAGCVLLLKQMHEFMDDQPRAPEVLGPFFAEFVASGHASLKTLLGAPLAVPPVDAEAKDPPLVEAGGASTLLTTLMQRLKELQGEEAAAKAWEATELDALQFFDEFAREDVNIVKEDLAKDGLGFLIKA